MDDMMGITGGVVASALGIGLVRWGWGGRRAVAWAGWATVALALVVLAMLDGAWGIAVAATGAMVAAMLLLARAGWAAPVGRIRPMREPPSVTMPRLRDSGIGRRLAVFALVVPAGLAASAALAFGAQAAALRAGWEEADATVLMLFLQPTAWALLAAFQIIRSGPAAMIAPLLICAAAGLGLGWMA